MSNSQCTSGRRIDELEKQAEARTQPNHMFSEPVEALRRTARQVGSCEIGLRLQLCDEASFPRTREANAEATNKENVSAPKASACTRLASFIICKTGFASKMEAV